MSERTEQILELWKQGLTSTEIARRLGYRSRGMVVNHVSVARERGDPRAVVRQRGSKRRSQ